MDQLTKHQSHPAAGALGFGLAFAMNALLILLFMRLHPGLALARLSDKDKVLEVIILRHHQRQFSVGSRNGCVVNGPISRKTEEAGQPKAIIPCMRNEYYTVEN
jgi:hypothetical protein